MIAKNFLSAGLVALVFALASAPQPAQANWIDDASSSGQRVFQATFDTWTESDLRSYLLDRGIISPASTKEQLVVMAKQDYDSLGSSASSATNSAASSASSLAQSVYSRASSVQSMVSCAPTSSAHGVVAPFSKCVGFGNDLTSSPFIRFALATSLLAGRCFRF